MAQLHVLPGDGTERIVDLADRAVSFGRAETNDVVLTEQKASRTHCTFRKVRGGWRVVDEQSTNGTWLGGKPVLSARLQAGDEIEIGDTVITFVAEPAEMPKPDLTKPRRVRKVQMPWGGLVAAVALAVGAWFVTGSMAQEQRTREIVAWKRVAQSEIDAAAAGRDAAAYTAALQRAVTELRTHDLAKDAVTILEGAIAQGLPPEAPTASRKAEWAQTLDQIAASRTRLSVQERRTRLRDLLARSATDPAAVEAIVAAIRADDASARERSRSEAARLLADAETAAKAGDFALAIEDWAAWLAAAQGASKDEERTVAKRIAEVREQARLEAGTVLAQYEEHLKEGRLSAANSLADAAGARLRGTGWDAWLAARTHRFDRGEPSPGAPSAGGPRESDDVRARRLAKEKVDRALRASTAFAQKRRFGDAAVALSDVAGDVTDAAQKADLAARVEDLTTAADTLSGLLRQIREEPARFAIQIPVAGGTAKVAGATDAAVLVADGGAQRPVAVEDLPAGAFAPLFEKSKPAPEASVGVALVLHLAGDRPGYVAWMRKALAVETLREAASMVHARVLGTALPPGGYVPHPEDANAIATWDEGRAIRNRGEIARRTEELRKRIAKLDATKQAKQIDAVAQAYARLEAARNHALELIFDEVKYFYPYRNRMREYVPVQREVDERVKKVEEAWADPASAKVRTDASLEKLMKEAEDEGVEITYLGGDVSELLSRVVRMRKYLNRELTVQTFFETDADLALLEYNTALLAANAKVRTGVEESEREQVRITNEYRRMFGHRRVLRLHEKLVAAARGHSDDMARLGFFDHFSDVPGKRSPMDRMLLAGYPNTPCSENIHMGSGDPQGAHNGWIHSSGHHRNILMPGWSEMGTGRSGKHWTQNFGFASGDEQVGGAGPQ